MITTPLATLNNGLKMPLLGLGVYDMYRKEAEQVVSEALEIGYRLIDTASMYDNETEVGSAVRSSGIPRTDIWITTKVGNGDQGYEATLKAYDESLKKLQMDYVDLYLVHWPIPGHRKDTWRALERLLSEGRVRSIGVANYLIPFLKELEGYAKVVPVLNQVEFTPWLFNKDLLDYCTERHIQLQSYSPITRGRKLSDPRLTPISEKYHKTPAQVVLRWNLDHGISTIPKSSKKERLQENFDILDFSLTKEEVALMDSLNENFRICDNPMDFL